MTFREKQTQLLTSLLPFVHVWNTTSRSNAISTAPENFDCYIKVGAYTHLCFGTRSYSIKIDDPIIVKDQILKVYAHNEFSRKITRFSKDDFVAWVKKQA